MTLSSPEEFETIEIIKIEEVDLKAELDIDETVLKRDFDSEVSSEKYCEEETLFEKDFRLEVCSEKYCGDDYFTDINKDKENQIMQTAQPNENDYCNNVSDHWADLNVVAESDNEEEISKTTCNTKEFENESPKKWYKCRLCVYQSLTVQILISHMCRKHTFIDNGFFYVCGFCKCKEGNDESLREHLEQEHVPKEQIIDDPWKWKICRQQKPTKNKTRKLLKPDQISILESVFETHKYIDRYIKSELAEMLQIEEAQVVQWFKNKRKRKSKKR